MDSRRDYAAVSQLAEVELTGYPRSSYSRPSSEDFTSISVPPKATSTYSTKLLSSPGEEIERRSFVHRGRSRPHILPLWWRRRQSTGWRFGVQVAAGVTTLALTTNTILTAWASTHFPVSNGIGTAFAGSCDTVNNWSRWLHVVINILSSIVLAMSNYCMQCLTSPSREELDRAHAKGDWLDIGVVSIRNLSRIRWTRTVLWVLLAVSSVPVHLLYNSAIFKTQENVSYNVLVVAPQFLTETNVSAVTSNIKDQYFAAENAEIRRLSAITAHHQYRNTSLFLNQSNADCMAFYDTGYISGRRSVILVTEPGNQAPNDTRGPVLQFFVNQTAESHEWLQTCLDYGNCKTRNPYGQANGWYVGGDSIAYCLNELEPEHCSLQFSIDILIVVIVANLFKAVAMLATLFVHGKTTVPLVTIGDAVADYLDRPDETTTGMCLGSKAEVCDWIKAEKTVHLVKWTGRVSRWWKASSYRRRAYCLWAHFAIWMASVVLLDIALQPLQGFSSPTGLYQLGFGNPNPHTIIGTGLPQGGANGLILAALLANLPQALLSVFNLAYNSLFTCMLLSDEWSRYSIRRRGLRVSAPQREQRSTYWLQLPYKFSVPMLVIWTFIHWLVSQSLFLVRIADYTAGEPPKISSAAGFSGLPLIFFVAVDGAMLVLLMSFGWRKFPSAMPIAGSCSAAISAACHKPAEETDAAIKKVMWGSIDVSEGELGHCGLSTEAVSLPQVDKEYAGTWRRRRP